MRSSGSKWELSEFMVFVGWPSQVKCPDDEALIKTLAEADFNTIMWDVGKLPLCRRYGLKLMVHHGELGWEPEGDDEEAVFWREYTRKVGPFTPEMATRVSEDPAIWGYMIFDEPVSEQFPEMAGYLRAFEQADSRHPVYINLLSGGGEYLESFMQVVKPQVLSYDYYQWWWGREGHFSNLEEYRRAALSQGMPLFCWIEVNADPDREYGEGTYLPDNPVKLRQSVYTSLAYGVKGIEWFTGDLMFESESPNLNDCGRDVAVLNAELKRLGPVLVKLESVDVWHTLPLPRDTRQLPADYWVHPKVVSWRQRAWNLVVGVFRHREDESADYLMVANRKIDQKREAALEFEPRVESVEKLDKQTGRWTTLPLSTDAEGQFATVMLAPGDGELLRVSRTGD